MTNIITFFINIGTRNTESSFTTIYYKEFEEGEKRKPK